jgi:hypothetical protein
MNVFTVIDTGLAIMRSRGVYKQVELYTYGERVFAKWNGGYIGLMKHQNGTTKPDVHWIETNLTPAFKDGNMVYEGVK